MENRYGEWCMSAMMETRKKVLMTISNILEDSDKELTETELEKLNYCWDILRDMKKIECDTKKIECMEHQMQDTHGPDAAEALGHIAEALHHANGNGNGNAKGNVQQQQA